MKKDHPHPFPSPSIQELIALYEKAAAEVSFPETLYRKDPSQSKSKRLSSIPEEDEEKQSLLREETVHASTNPPTLLTGSGSKKQQKPETIHSTVTSQVTLKRATRVLSEEEIIQLLPYHSLIRAYQEEIQHLSASAYGNPNILQKKMQEIQKNPAAGEEFSWRMAAYPESIAKLSGASMLGFKNRARKQAKESFSALSITIDCYTEAVKQARESLLQSPEQELKNYERLIGKAAVTELLKKPDQREKQTLSEAEISTKIQQHSKVKRHHAQIKYWCGIVFGNANILQSQVETLFQNAETIEALAQQLVRNPQSFHKYAGISLCGFKNQARRHAEAGLSHLIDAAENYATAVTQVRESILQTEQAKQRCHEPSSKQAQDLYQQQRLPQAVERTELSTVTHEEAITSTQQRDTDFRPRKTAIPKAMAFAS
ncbi:BID domain-containing T4SS effector [Bartonella sp. OT172YNZD]|uniref:BID domain-containing T4SS effector n=1 Tax=Bartonella sp. OT172YNZD TaxID=3243572 RepID=UPI0035CE9A45